MIPNSHLGITHTKAEPRLRNSSKRGSICWAVVGSMWQSRSVYRLCPPATALLHRSYSRVTFDLGFPAFYEFQWQGSAHAASESSMDHRAQSPFGQTVRSAAAEKLGSAGSFFAPYMISGRSTRKGGLGGKIRAPCILNRPIAPGNGCIGRGSCHSDLEKHTFRQTLPGSGLISRIRRKGNTYGAILAS